MYYFRKNLQGDITGIYNATGTLVVEYEYTPYGALLSTTGSMSNTIGAINPFRYRGYYYDAETGFYYLQTRYYDPVVGRFLNADAMIGANNDIVGYNIFSYCSNSPIMYRDPCGTCKHNGKDKRCWMCKICNGIKSAAEAVGDFFSDTFGAESSTTVTISETETQIIPDPSPITIETGTTTTYTASKSGDASKPISVYANNDAKHPIKSSSAGLNINILNFTLNLNLALDDIGIYGSLANGDKTNSFGLKLNLSELKIGFEGSTEIRWDDMTETAYTNVSFSGWALFAVYCFVATGQVAPSPSYAY